MPYTYTRSSGGRKIGSDTITGRSGGSYRTDLYGKTTGGRGTLYGDPLFRQYDIYSQIAEERQKDELRRFLTNKEIQALRRMNETYSARTGGRAGYEARGVQDIGGQYAMALQAGLAQIAQQRLQDRWKLLQAYIQKYGIDKNAQLAMEQLASQQDIAMGQSIGNLFSNLISTALLLEFL